ncbi:MAG: hypothetical protein ACPKPY_00525 [Nitrososphaeraceae archaeon]
MVSKTKIGIFGVLLFATMMMLVPASLADIYASEKKDDRHYDNKRGYDGKDYSSERYYIKDNYYDDSYKKKPAILEIKKELFVCDDILNLNETNREFNCNIEVETTDGRTFFFVSPPDSGQYISCDDIECPLVDESDFKLQVFSDSIADDLSSTVPTPVDLTKINYFVTEDEQEDPISVAGICTNSGFQYPLTFDSDIQDVIEENQIADYSICVLHEGDCEGTISPGEVKQCTIKNFIRSGSIHSVEDMNG